MTTPKHEDSQVSRPTGSTNNPSATPREPDKGASPDEIEADIERTRRELGETVEALAGKLDVKSQAREQVNEAKHRIVEQTNETRQHAVRYLERAKASATNEQGKPNTYAWIGVATVAAVAAIIVARRPRR
ncbi:DUF3618 domain-containing protein [Nesterenkonia sp. CF4.4]|uniref:DUF3618 domain-containing protein n=1 Tax=Nesterenkonia sp. CF4.4 TaxID=3373079 RepID=UPI003EE81C76